MPHATEQAGCNCQSCTDAQRQGTPLEQDTRQKRAKKTYEKKQYAEGDSRTSSDDLRLALWFIGKVGSAGRALKIVEAAVAAMEAADGVMAKPADLRDVKDQAV